MLPSVDASAAATIAALLLCALTTSILLVAYRGIRETTLLSAWWWSLASVAGLASLAVVSANLRSRSGDLVDAFRFAAAALTFCPIISVLGSKRPQHKAWNFIVLSLWAVVALPAAEMALLQRGQALEVNDARGWFLWLLLLLLPVNYVPTRYWFPSLAISCGQMTLLAEHLPLVRWKSGFDEITAILLVTIGAASAFMISRRSAQGANRFDSLWLGFRDAFGLLWALRAAERVNATAQQLEWPIELRWKGFCNRDDGTPLNEIPNEVERPLKQTLSGLLRRFVSSRWIASRFVDDVD